MQYSFGKSALKGLKSVGIVVGMAVLTAFSSQEFLSAAKDLPASTLIVPILQWLAVFGLDWLKHRNIGA